MDAFAICLLDVSEARTPDAPDPSSFTSGFNGFLLKQLIALCSFDEQISQLPSVLQLSPVWFCLRYFKHNLDDLAFRKT